MQVIEKKISELRPYERNAKKHGERQLQELTKSIQRYGFRNPVLIDKDGTIIAGHGRVEAAKRAGLSEVPCVCYDDMTPEEVREYRIADNRLAEIGGTGWDFEALNFELSELDFGELELDWGIDLGDESKIYTGSNKEINTEDYADEQFKCECPRCGFRFNKA